MKSNSIQGKFVNDEHIHLTVEFLGEIQNNRLDLIKHIQNDYVIQWLNELDSAFYIIPLNKNMS